MSTRNIVTSLEELPQCRPKRRRVLLARDQCRLSVGCRFGGDLWTIAGVGGFCRDNRASAGFHGPLQPFDGFIDPSVVLLGIGNRLLPEGICLMKARCSAIHAALPDPEVPPRSASSMIAEPVSLT
ncbi:hypothetical protein JQ580_24525 [Bradyrhizobium japonicum]|uniref:hypothetical protein n=1 Tax=Bradyrhizobium japonicum TaxID=375 RepID=UPI001BA54A51|nr:hypothetical protein [Bradyrhizobium japonicum]MBR0993895.1 hypothetical protein [Bradyrhizobium japonicum]